MSYKLSKFGLEFKNLKFYKNLFVKIKKNELNFLFFIYLLILCFWFLRFLNTNDFQKLIQFDIQNYYFKPYLSSLIFDFTSNILLVEITGFLIIVVIPFAILILTQKVFDFFLSSKLSFLFAILTQTIYSEINLRDLFFNLNSTLERMESSFPLIFKFPFPSVSTLFFLLIFSWFINNRSFNNNLYKLSLLTILCSTYFYINAIDSSFLLASWFMLLIFDTKKISPKNKISQLFLSLAILIPGIYYGEISNIHVYSKLNLYNILLYNVLPLVLSLLLFFTKRIDIKEVWFKFKYIYLFILIELLLNLIVYFKIINLDLTLANRQILQFPIHMMYYLPLIYYLKRKPQNYSYGLESKNLSLNFSKMTYFLFEKSKNFVFYTLLILIYYFNFPK